MRYDGLTVKSSADGAVFRTFDPPWWRPDRWLWWWLMAQWSRRRRGRLQIEFTSGEPGKTVRCFCVGRVK